jgi:hypothetical protein
MRLILMSVALVGCTTLKEAPSVERRLRDHDLEIQRIRGSLINELCSTRYQDCILLGKDIEYCRDYTSSCYESFKLK